jgi:UDP-hydrolysing UDP-N-acetyl-D-glucosamine 2-epimerase
MAGFKKICVITCARSEYGLLKWLMLEIKKDLELKLQLIVTGSHLSTNFGYTVNEIEKDGFIIDEKVDMHLEEISPVKIAQSMGHCMIGLSTALDKLKPDILVLLGDRYELLAIAGTALVMNIPIAHISGGDITEGAIDDQIRHAVSKLATIHFPGNEESAKRLVQMGENPNTVFNVGEPGLDSFLYLDFISRENLAKLLDLDEDQKWVVCTYHPETKIETQTNLSRVRSILDALLEFADLQVVVSKANADNGGTQINELLLLYCKKYPERIILFDSLGQLKYLSLLKSAFFMIGNSSSAIFEAPVIPLPAINIGERQSGRFTCNNILQSNGSKKDIVNKIDYIYKSSKEYLENIESPYGKGGTAIKIKNILKSVSGEQILKKGFYDAQ